MHFSNPLIYFHGSNLDNKLSGLLFLTLVIVIFLWKNELHFKKVFVLIHSETIEEGKVVSVN